MCARQALDQLNYIPKNSFLQNFNFLIKVSHKHVCWALPPIIKEYLTTKEKYWATCYYKSAPSQALLPGNQC